MDHQENHQEDQENVYMDTEVVYPVLFIPETCTTLDTDGEMSDNVYLEDNITTPDTTGNETRIYTGLCNDRLFETDDVQNCVESPNKDSSGTSGDNIDVDQIPIINSEFSPSAFPSHNQSQVCVEPCRSPYVYNRCKTPPSQERCSMRESRGYITVEHHNTYVTRNAYHYKESSNTVTYTGPDNRINHKMYKKMSETGTNQCDSNKTSYEEDEFECGVFLSNLPEEIINEEQNKAREELKLVGLETENNALKQLMSKEIQSVSKQMKTILFFGKHSQSDQMIQNIAYSEPLVNGSEMEVDHEVIIETSPSSSTSSKEMYQCDDCKQVYHQISDFHHHITNHTSHTRSLDRDVCSPIFVCSQCDKKFKSQEKFNMHCLKHGNPELECPKCRKVYASKFTLRVHLKTHARRFPCSLCFRSYSVSDQLKTHLSKAHLMITCKYEECLFKTTDPVLMNDHYHSHIYIYMESSNNDFGDILISDEELQSSKDVTSEHASLLRKFCTEDVANGNDEDMDRSAEPVIAKAKSNKIFLLNSEKAKTAGKCYKSCGVCYKTFNRVSDLKRHLIEHAIRSALTKISPSSRDGILNIVCEVCKSETFTKIDKYKAHLREHAKLTIYKCTVCDKSFSDSSNFSKHKKVHGISYYHCDLCQRKFHSKKMLVKHIQYHNQNSPVECHYCNKKFHFKSMLNKHIKCVHKQLRNTKYNCRFCDAFFKALKHKWEHEWTVHNIRKTIIDCHTCGSKFRKYSELKRHCLVNHEIDTSRTELKRNKKRAMDF